MNAWRAATRASWWRCAVAWSGFFRIYGREQFHHPHFRVCSVEIGGLQSLWGHARLVTIDGDINVCCAGFVSGFNYYLVCLRSLFHTRFRSNPGSVQLQCSGCSDNFLWNPLLKKASSFREALPGLNNFSANSLALHIFRSNTHLRR